MINKDRVKIAVVTSVHFPALEPRIYFKEIGSLSKEFEVHYIFPHDNIQTLPDMENVINHPFPKSDRRLNRLFSQRHIIQILGNLAEVKIVHLHDPELLPLGLLLKKWGYKVIFDMHEDVLTSINEKRYLPKIIRNRISHQFNLLFDKAKDRIDYWILAEDSYKNYFINMENVEVIHNYPCLSYVTEIATPSNNLYNLIYSGRITSERGSLQMLNVIKELCNHGINAQLILIGLIPTASEEGYDEEKIIKKIVQENRIEKNVKFIGVVPNNKVFEILSKGSLGLALLQPMKNYLHSYPTKVFEYMSVGLPVIISNFPLYKKIIVECNCGFGVDPNNLDQIVNTILTLFKNKDLMDKMGRKGREAVFKLYNWSNEENKLFNLYNYIFHK